MEKIMEKGAVLDALIVGSGPAGATAALLLAQKGWSVGIIEKKTFPRPKVCGEFMSATNLSLMNQLGLVDFYLANSGPEIQRVGLFAGDTILETAMPAHNEASKPWGRALGREHLDLALLERAMELGVKAWQPGFIHNMSRSDGIFTGTISRDGVREDICSRMIIMACGSWDGNLSSPACAPKPSDLFAFKAHFRHTGLAADLMPLIAFPGGYGGLVHSDTGRVSLSFCIRRDVLFKARKRYPGMQAGEAALIFIQTQCSGVRNVLEGAQRDGRWLACGPIQPGIRSRYGEGIFYIGNSAGEAHPIIAEGISMAMQSAWLLTQILIKRKPEKMSCRNLEVVGREYSRQWRKHFALRIHAAAFFSWMAMRVWPQSVMVLLLTCFPRMLTYGAQLSGKIKQVVLPERTHSINKEH